MSPVQEHETRQAFFAGMHSLNRSRLKDRELQKTLAIILLLSMRGPGSP